MLPAIFANFLLYVDEQNNLIIHNQFPEGFPYRSKHESEAKLNCICKVHGFFNPFRSENLIDVTSVYRSSD